jgi:probable rRNA maturation factor
VLTVDTEVAAGQWSSATDWAALATSAVAAALAQSTHAHLDHARYTVEVAVRLSDDADVQTLNAHYRHQDKATNVLSFPMVAADDLDALANGGDGEVLLGDIILAYETCAAEATAKDIPLIDHARHLIAHGMLHLLGLDHGDDATAAHMEGLETAALATLGLADPYAERD